MKRALRPHLLLRARFRCLPIADGSNMPRIARVATMAPSVFIGERMADILSKKG